MTKALTKAPLQRQWDDRFALDFAMTLEGSGSKPADLLKEYSLESAELEAFSLDPLFLKRVEFLRAQLKDKGYTFKLKAQMQSEVMLDTSWRIIHDDEVSPAVKADLIKWTAKMAGYEPTKDTLGGDGGVKINIFMGDATNAPPPGMRTIEHD